MSDLVHERNLERNVSEMLAEDIANIKKFKTAMQRQEGGLHYKFLPIQPIEFCQKNSGKTKHNAGKTRDLFHIAGP